MQQAMKKKFTRVTTAYLNNGSVLSSVTGSFFADVLPPWSLVCFSDRDIFTEWYHHYDTASEMAEITNKNQLLPLAM